MSLTLPYYLGKYELTSKLAEGEMTELYLARYRFQDHFQKKFAVKLISPKLSEDPSIVPMLIDEANIHSRLSHDNIVKIFELGVIDQPDPLFFLVMEYVHGINLAAFIQKIEEGYSVPVAYKIYIVHEILKGLQYIHFRRDEAGIPLQIVHRDIAPQNILLSYEGRVKIAGFGITKARKEAPFLDHRSDLFSTGVVLFELLTGVRAFEGDKFNHDALCSVEPELKTIIEKSLMTDPSARYSTAAEFSADLWQFMCARSLNVTDQGLASLLSVETIQQKKDLSDTEIKTPVVPSPINAFPEEVERVPPRRKTKRHFLYAGMMVVGCVATFLWGQSTRVKPEPITLKPMANMEMQAVKQGELSVVSDTWAHAKIDENNEERETPFNIVLNVGPHSIRLWRYEGEDRSSLEMAVVVDPEKQLRCYAVFQENPPKMICN